MKNPYLSLWLRWANQASAAWTGAVMAATRRNQATLLREMTRPAPSPRKSRRRRRPEPETRDE